jgi:hypothetical protein
LKFSDDLSILLSLIEILDFDGKLEFMLRDEYKKAELAIVDR